MCGINGFMMLGNSLPIEASEYLVRMNQRIQHRGPNDQGTYINTDKGLALGHLRLSIIDLSDAGHQPMFDDAGNCVVFNGEIYNYQTIKKTSPISNLNQTVILKYYYIFIRKKDIPHYKS